MDTAVTALPGGRLGVLRPLGGPAGVGHACTVDNVSTCGRVSALETVSPSVASLPIWGGALPILCAAPRESHRPACLNGRPGVPLWAPVCRGGWTYVVRAALCGSSGSGGLGAKGDERVTVPTEDRERVSLVTAVIVFCCCSFHESRAAGYGRR